MAIMAWSAKVLRSAICLSVNGRTSGRANRYRSMRAPSRSKGRQAQCRIVDRSKNIQYNFIVRIRGDHVVDMDGLPVDYCRSRSRPTSYRLVSPSS